MSIEARFAGPPQELAILVALAVESGRLTVRVFDGGPAKEGVPKERNVHLAAPLAEELGLVLAVEAAPLDVKVNKVSVASGPGRALQIMDHKVGGVRVRKTGLGG